MSTSTMQDDLETQAPNPIAKAVPPRRKWLRRFAIGGAVYVVALVLLRVWWGFAAQNRLDQQIAEYQAAGQLVFASEFDEQLDAVDPSENAAVLYERAMNVYVGTSTSGVSVEDFMREPESFRTLTDDADELMQANAEALMLIHEARSRTKVAWSERLDTRNRGIGLVSVQRALSKFLWFAATYQVRTGDHASAVDTLADSVVFGEAVGAHPQVISTLVAWAVEDLCLGWIEDHGSALAISGAKNEIDTGISPTTRADLEEIAEVLMDDHRVRRDAIHATYGSRSSTLVGISATGFSEQLAQQTNPWIRAPAPVNSSIVDFVARPAIVIDARRAIQNEGGAARVFAEATWPLAATHFLPETDLRPTLLNRLTHPVTFTAFGFANKSSENQARLLYKLLARRRMAAVALMIRLYEVDHGQRPSELAALVPSYLARLPQDPFANQDQGFGYAPDAERPMLYSVGPDGKDNGGKIARRIDGRRDRTRSDIPFYLDPKPPDASSAETKKNDQDVQNTEREKAQQDDPKSDPDQGKPKS